MFALRPGDAADTKEDSEQGELWHWWHSENTHLSDGDHATAVMFNHSCAFMYRNGEHWYPEVGTNRKGYQGAPSQLYPFTRETAEAWIESKLQALGYTIHDDPARPRSDSPQRVMHWGVHFP